jgi:U3 small nucleolar RNA-associated protein 18
MSKAGRKRSRAEEGGERASVNPRAQPIDDEESRLAALVFGSSSSAPSASRAQKQQRREGDADVAAASGPSWAKADGDAPAWKDDDDDRLRVDIANTARLRKLRQSQGEKTVSGAEYSKRLREQFSKGSGGNSSSAGGGVVGQTPEWARLPEERAYEKKAERARGADDSDDEYSDEEEMLDEAAVLRETGKLTQASRALPQGQIGLSRLRDANLTDPSRSVVNALGFHPSGSVLMVGSLDQRLRFFRVDGKKNSRILSAHFKDMPVTSASWLGNGQEVIATGRRPFFYTYDVNAGKLHRIPRLQGREEKSLESVVVSPADPAQETSMLAFLGSDGFTILASARTKQWVGNLKMEGTVRAAAFSRGSTGGGRGAGPLDYPELLTTGSLGSVYRWDLRTMRCMGKHVDEGSTGGTALAATRDGSYYAVGSNMGVVNCYSTESVRESQTAAASTSVGPLGLFAADANPKPMRTIMSLTTAVDTVTYSHDGGMMLVASQRVRDSLKLVHTASGTIFANWPTNKTPLRYVTAAAFSPNSGYLTIGNDAGKVLLYRLHHYTSA